MAKRKQAQSDGRQPKVKVSKQENAAKKELIATVKCALTKRCLDNALWNRIQDDVKIMSALAVEATLLIYFDLMRKFERREFPTADIPFGQYFRVLSTKNEWKLDQEYRQLRGNLPFYNCDYRSNIIQEMINRYKTAFKNNLKMHAWNRLRRFFKTLQFYDEEGNIVVFDQTEMNAQILATLKYLFYEITDSVPSQILLDAMEDHLFWNGDRLFDIDTNRYYKHVQLYYDLQRYNENNRHKNFKLIPLHSFGSKHIQYDTQALFYTLKALGKMPSDHIPQEMRNGKSWHRDYVQRYEQDQMWKKYFKPVETVNRKFRYSIKTDGVAVSFSMCNENKHKESLNGDPEIGE